MFCFLKVNGIAPGAVVNARSVGTKWNHLVKKRRLDRQFSGSEYKNLMIHLVPLHNFVLKIFPNSCF